MLCWCPFPSVMEFSRWHAHLFLFYPDSGFSQVLESPNLASGPCLASSSLPHISYLLPPCICRGIFVPAPSLGTLPCGAEMVLFPSDKDSLLDQTLVRLLWTLFSTGPCHWPAEPSIVKVSTTPDTHAVYFINFLLVSFHPLTLYRCPLAINLQLSLLCLDLSLVLYWSLSPLLQPLK